MSADGMDARLLTGGSMDNPESWEYEREQLNQRIAAARRQGLCYSCYDLATGSIFGNQAVIYDNERFRVVLDPYPRMVGHTMVVYKPHREDVSELSQEEIGHLFQFCLQVVHALKTALHAEKVYLNTMCDGSINHVHIQLFPRYAGDTMGSKRFVLPRGPLENGEELVRLIRSALLL
jgi:diadenosine tetraphosphate (Ap4A) HIT family hydrolase